MEARPTPHQARLDLGRLGLSISSRCDRGSGTAARQSSGAGRPRRGVICAVCHSRDASFRAPSVVKTAAAHRLCFRCYRAEAGRHRLALERLRLQASARLALRPTPPSAPADGGVALDLWLD